MRSLIDDQDQEQLDPLTCSVIGGAIEVHKHLGPGLLECAYEECPCHELTLRGLSFQRPVALPLNYRGELLDLGYRMDLVVDSSLVVEIKAVERLKDLHRAQLLTYLRLSGIRKGLRLNFFTPYLRDGIVRIVN